MMFKPVYILFVSLIGLFSCSENKEVPTKNTDKTPLEKNEYTHQHGGDSHTYANLKEIHTTHLHLDLDVNFQNKSIYCKFHK